MSTTENEFVLQNLAEIATALNEFYLLIMGVLVFSMQLGFTLLEAGGVRKKNVNNILTKNFLDAMVGSICYWLVGYALSYGETAGGFLGTTNFLLLDADTSFAGWFFQFVFNATAATIVSGSVAERVSFESYLIYSVFLTAFVYPVGTHWVWSDSAWLAAMGFKDFAGSTVVHGLGGAAAFSACYFLGPRLGRFNPDGTPNQNVRGHSSLLTALGGMLLWLGFLAFNGGSTLQCIVIEDDGSLTSIANDIAKIFGVTIMSGCGGTFILTNTGTSGGLSLLIYVRIRTGKWSVNKMINGSLAGLVSICASADDIQFYNALVVGIIGGAIYELGSNGLLKLKMDDPVDAIPVHLGGGIWGTIAAGLFRTGDSLFYTGNIRLLGIQVLGTVAVCSWSLITMGLFFALLSYLKIYRVPEKDELSGLDEKKHDGAVYSNKSWSQL